MIINNSKCGGETICGLRSSLTVIEGMTMKVFCFVTLHEFSTFARDDKHRLKLEVYEENSQSSRVEEQSTALFDTRSPTSMVKLFYLWKRKLS